jgi:hypothetical protein
VGPTTGLDGSRKSRPNQGSVHRPPGYSEQQYRLRLTGLSRKLYDSEHMLNIDWCPYYSDGIPETETIDTLTPRTLF